MPGSENLIAAIAAQVPVTALFVWFVVWMRKQEGVERREREETQAKERQLRETQYATHRDTMIDRFDATLKTMTGEMLATTRSVETLSVILLHHDATVRGENPEVLGSHSDLLKRLGKLNLEVPK